MIKKNYEYKEDKRPNRSDKYQSFYYESTFPIDHWIFTKAVDDNSNSEKVLELKDKLKEAYWDLLKRIATERQLEVATLHAAGFTQDEIAKKTGTNQSSIHKCLFGNTQYLKDNKAVHYGGLYKKVRREAEIDPTIQDLLKQISDIIQD